jgi:hypothetical protein
VFRTVSQPELTFELSRGVVPFPNNAFFRGSTLPDGGANVLPDGGAPGDDAVPGVRLSMPTPGGVSVTEQRLFAGLNTLDGFSLTAPVVSENSAALAALDFGALDAGSLSGATGFVKLAGPATLLGDGGVRAATVRACLNCASSLSDAGVLAQPEQLQWVPQQPLDEASRYGVWVTTAARSSQGKPVMAAPSFALARLRSPLVDTAGRSALPFLTDGQASQLEPVRRRFKPCLDALEAQGVPRRTQALAFCFTTQSVVAPLRALVSAVNTSGTSPTPTWLLEATSMARLGLGTTPTEIGRASCRERVS